MIDILLAVPHPILADTMQAMLDREADMHVVATTDNEKETLAFVEQLQPTIIVLDISNYRWNGVRVVKTLIASQSHVAVVAVGDSELPYDAHQMLVAGAAGYLAKSRVVDQLAETVRNIVATRQE